MRTGRLRTARPWVKKGTMPPQPPPVIAVNGADRPTSARNVAELLDELGLSGLRVAVMVNDEIVRRGDRAARILLPGDRVEIISMVGGG